MVPIQPNTNTIIYPPNISDHALINLQDHDRKVKRKRQFKFINSSCELEGFLASVDNSWSTPLLGRPMYPLWQKLMRLQPVMRKLTKPLFDISNKIVQARKSLMDSQINLVANKMDRTNIEAVKHWTEEVIKWQEIEEQVMHQSSKVERLRLGDRNRTYFHATIKAKRKHQSMKGLYNDDGTQMTSQGEIEEEILAFYTKLMGKVDTNLKGIYVPAIRKGNHPHEAQRKALTKPVTYEEVWQALKGIGDLKTQSLDGFGTKIF